MGGDEYEVTLASEPAFKQYGSADVLIQSENACRVAKYTICDNEATPGTRDADVMVPRGRYQPNDVMEFKFKIPSFMHGAGYELSYYKDFNADYSITPVGEALLNRQRT